MKLLVIRDVSRNKFALIVNGERIGEFASEADAWRYAQDAFGIVESATDAKSFQTAASERG